MLKKLLCILCVLLSLTLVFSACDNNSGSKKNNNKSSSDSDEKDDDDKDDEDKDKDNENEDKEDNKDDKDDENKDSENNDDQQVDDEKPSDSLNVNLDSALFDNCYFELRVVFDNTPDYEAIIEYAMNGDYISVGRDQELAEDAETAALIREVMVGSFVKLVKNASFTYDEALDVYTADGPVQCTASFTDNSATITATNLVLTLDAENRIAELSCHMEQNGISFGETVELSMTVSCAFSSYGEI